MPWKIFATCVVIPPIINLLVKWNIKVSFCDIYWYIWLRILWSLVVLTKLVFFSSCKQNLVLWLIVSHVMGDINICTRINFIPTKTNPPCQIPGLCRVQTECSRSVADASGDATKLYIYFWISIGSYHTYIYI